MHSSLDEHLYEIDYIMNVIFWVVNCKTQNYFVISTTYIERLPQVIYVRLL
jgi:hypothetical protein